MKRDRLEGLDVFLAVAEAKNFRIAGERLGVSASAISQALRKLEERLGVALVRRTTRSVSLSDAGEQLYSAVRPALQEVETALTAVGDLGDVVRGPLRLLVGTAADAVLGGPVLSSFLKANPMVTLDIVVSDAVGDIIAEGFDAGIQIGEVINRDMTAVPVTGDIRMTVVGAPSYFEHHPKPRHPRDLVEHQCLNWRSGPGAPPYRWEFTAKGREIVVDVPSRVVSTDSAVNIRLARAGLGVAIVYEDQVREEVARRELIPVLKEFCEPFAGYYLFYPQRRQTSRALRALIDHLLTIRKRQRRRTTNPAGDASRSQADRVVGVAD
jgi:DNA-binding transcriptional LysR family regulator